MKILKIVIIIFLVFYSKNVFALTPKKVDIRQMISKAEFLQYENVADFIDHSPKVTIQVKPKASDIAEYGPHVVKSLTGSDCDRDGKMDDNKTCNAVYYKLWMAYAR